MRLNITQTNMLAVLRKHGRIKKEHMGGPGGRYYNAIYDLIRIGLAKLDDGFFVLTPAGEKACASSVGANGLDPRSRMKGLK